MARSSAHTRRARGADTRMAANKRVTAKQKTTQKSGRKATASGSVRARRPTATRRLEAGATDGVPTPKTEHGAKRRRAARPKPRRTARASGAKGAAAPARAPETLVHVEAPTKS